MTVIRYNGDMVTRQMPLILNNRRRQARQCGREPVAGSHAGHQRRKRGAAGCTAPQTGVTALLVSAMGNTVTASGTKAAICFSAAENAGLWSGRPKPLLSGAQVIAPTRSSGTCQ